MAGNWFVALPIAGDWMARRVPAPPPDFRLLHPDDLHLTVAFLGPCGHERAQRAWAALRWPLPPLEATLGEVVAMGPAGRYSALAALLVEGREALERAIALVREPICAAARVAADPRPVAAHVTLARPRRRATPEARRQGLRWAAALRLHDVRIRIDRVSLYTWAQDRTERLFRRVETTLLGP